MQATYESAPDLAKALRRSAHSRHEADLGHPGLVWPQSRAVHRGGTCRARRPGHPVSKHMNQPADPTFGPFTALIVIVPMLSDHRWRRRAGRRRPPAQPRAGTRCGSLRKGG